MTTIPTSSSFRRPFRLTRARRAILRLLVGKTYLKTADFYRLLAPATLASPQSQASFERSTRRILKDFAERRYLNRKALFEDRDGDGRLHYQHLYWLSRAGLALSRKEGLDDGTGKSNDEKSVNMLRHEDEITQFHLALEAGCAQYGRELYWRRTDLRHAVNPDALFGITDPQKPDARNTNYFFLEVEKSRQGNYRNNESGLIRKLRTYFRYRRTADCLRDWKFFDDFRVVIIVRNTERKANLLERLREVYPYSMFWVATEEDCRRDVMGKIFGTPKGIEQSVLDL